MATATRQRAAPDGGRGTSDSVAPAIVVSGHTMALAVVRALGEAGVPVAVVHYDPRDMAQASRYVVADIRVPDPLVDEPGFVDALVAAAGRFTGAVLVPASDESVVAVSRAKPRLAPLCHVACPDADVVERFIDKTRTYALAAQHAIPAPRTLVPGCDDEVADCGREIGFPLLLKPAEGHLFLARFRKKMLVAESAEQLRRFYGMARDAGLRVMLQEIIPGPDSSVVNYNAYFWSGEALAEFTARQLRKAPPAFGSPRVAVSERIVDIVEPGRAILRAIGHDGFACTEFKRDRRDGIYKLMEVNGRHNLSGLLAVRCGVNFPLLQYRHLAEGIVPQPVRWRSGVYWTDIVRDIGYSLASIATDRHRLADYVAPYARSHCDAIFDVGDMGPFVARVRYLTRNIAPTAAAAGTMR